MRIDDPKRVAEGYLIRVRETPARDETEAAAMLRAFGAALEAMPEGEQAQRTLISYGRDRGEHRKHSRRFFLSLLTGPRR